MSNDPIWSDEDRAEVLRLYHLGYSRGKTAEAMAARRPGTSRNAIVGLLRRCGITNSIIPPTTDARVWLSYPIERLPTVKRPRRAQPAKKVAKVEVEMPAPRPERAPVELVTTADGVVRDFLDLPRGRCKWPIGDPGRPGFHFCAKVALTAENYCAKHKAAAYHGKGSSGRDLSRALRRYA